MRRKIKDIRMIVQAAAQQADKHSMSLVVARRSKESVDCKIYLSSAREATVHIYMMA